MEILGILNDTPAPNLFIAVGALLVVLSFTGKIGAFIEIPAARQKMAIIVGAICLCAGAALHALPSIIDRGPDQRPDQQNNASNGITNDGKKYYVVLGSFSTEFDANRSRQRFQAAGLPAKVLDTDQAEGFTPGLYAVVVGPSDRRNAIAMLELSKEHQEDSFLREAKDL